MTDAELIAWRRKDWPKVLRRIQEHREEMGREGEWLRIFSLLDRQEQMDIDLLEWSFLYRQHRDGIVTASFIADKVKKTLKARQSVSKEMQHLLNKPGKKIKTDEITDAMISRAREHSLENLLDVKRDIARCVSGKHEDKNPSMNTKNNFAYCYSCGWSGDAIDVAMKVYGINFKDAVKRLQ